MSLNISSFKRKLFHLLQYQTEFFFFLISDIRGSCSACRSESADSSIFFVVDVTSNGKIITSEQWLSCEQLKQARDIFYITLNLL